ncbi:MAG: hypothetical protein MI742_13270 [Desulfobacterales bacterium]|nr:hypothetical protein [Desulfobacterales bacterium]
MEYRCKTPTQETTFTCAITQEGFETEINNTAYTVSAVPIDEKRMHLFINGKSRLVYIESMDGGKRITLNGTSVEVKDAFAAPDTGSQEADAPGDVTPPMPSVVVAILVQKGDEVTQGTPLITLSAMKMETTLSAPVDGIVTAIQAEPGAQVMPGEILVALEPTPDCSELSDKTGT